MSNLLLRRIGWYLFKRRLNKNAREALQGIDNLIDRVRDKSNG